VIELDHGTPDGFAFDAQGNLIVACPNFDPGGGDIQVYSEGRLTEVIRPGNSKLYTNVAISQDCQLYICDADTGNVLAETWPRPGLPLHPFR
jgi:gluconolactonase